MSRFKEANLLEYLNLDSVIVQEPLYVASLHVVSVEKNASSCLQLLLLLNKFPKSDIFLSSFLKMYFCRFIRKFYIIT